MNQFVVTDDGAVYEASVRQNAIKLKQLFPDIDATALEANLMLERSHRLLAGRRESHWARYGLTGRRLILLRLLYTSAHKRLSMGEIASEMHLSSNNVTQLVAGLVRDGLVEREAGTEDKRVIYAVLTEKGASLFEAVLPENTRRIEAAWAPLSESEQKLLISLLARLRLHLLAGRSTPE